MKCSSALFLLLVPCSSPSAILGVFPTFSRSHFAVFEPLMSELVARNHSVVMISPYPLAEPARHYVHIDIQKAREKFNGSWSLESFPQIPPRFHNVLSITADNNVGIENIFELKSVRDFLSSKSTFDLIIVEEFTSDVFLGFAHRFKAPLITFSTCPPMPWTTGRYGVPASLAISPNLFSGFSDEMSFAQRTINVIQTLFANLYRQLVYDTVAEQTARQYFSHDIPSLEEIANNASLFLVNSHFQFFGPRPLPPQVVEVGGIHVTAARPLHKDLDRWMNESSDGVIYFSFGSMLRGATLPADKVKAFLQVFKTLPQRVLWKWEDDTVQDLPSNVKIMKWIPQRDVLAHPKVKVFISHGGLLGTTEAVVSGVPILGIPMYGDQPNNVAALVENGVAVHVDYNNISVASISYALNALINDKSYKENAKELSRRFLDRPMSPLDTAVYWTEYVIRHGGAPHLQSAAVHLTWYQYYLLDVIAVLAAAILVIISFVYYIIRSCLRLVCTSKPSKLKTN